MDGWPLPAGPDPTRVNMHTLTRRQFVDCDIATVFRFFEDPKNLEKITPPWLHFEVESSTDGRVRTGTEIVYSLRWHLFPMRWRSRIAEYEDGVRFVDEMLSGPYKRWYHRHLFTALENAVEMQDVVEYELPFGPLGTLAHTTVVRRQLASIFDYRYNAIARIFNDRPQMAKGSQADIGG